jgi:membrane protein YqaA with SNARE-associated domain
MWTRIAATLWGFAESTLFFIVPDVLLSAIAIRDLRKALFASVLATLGAMAGGSVMYFGSANPGQHDAIVRAVESLPDVRPNMPFNAQVQFQEYGAMATLLGPLSSTPYKVYAVQAPANQVPYWQFLLMTPAARLPRFLLVSCFAAIAARYLRPALGTRGLYALWSIAWLSIYLVLWRSLIF